MSEDTKDGLDTLRKWLQPILLGLIMLFGGFWADSMKDGQKSAIAQVSELREQIAELKALFIEFKTATNKDVAFTMATVSTNGGRITKLEEGYFKIQASFDRHVMTGNDPLSNEARKRLRMKY